MTPRSIVQIAIGSTVQQNIVLRADGGERRRGGEGVVNCQYTPSDWETFNLIHNDDGSYSFESTAWKGIYLRMDHAKVNLQVSLGPNEKFLLEPVPQGSAGRDYTKFMTRIKSRATNYYLSMSAEMSAPDPSGGGTVKGMERPDKTCNLMFWYLPPVVEPVG